MAMGLEMCFSHRRSLTWGNGHVAFHSVLGETLCAVTLDGKLRYERYIRRKHRCVRALLDGRCPWNALFLDDIFTILGDEARVTGSDEIRLGAGDDVLDLTSNRYFDASGKSMLIRGGDGNDVIYAGNIETTLINGGSGDDILVVVAWGMTCFCSRTILALIAYISLGRWYHVGLCGESGRPSVDC